MCAQRSENVAARLADVDWNSLSTGERIRHLEVEGYVVLPDLLSADLLSQLKQETSRLPTTGVDYSDRQRYCSEIEFTGGEITRLIAHPPTIDFLRQLLGDEIVMMTYAYARSEPGHPGISLHADGQPYGSAIFGYEGSCPRLIRVLYYLDDLTPDVSPFRVVPRSHLSLHADANPYLRYKRHPDELMVTATAGSAVIIHHQVFHGNFPNTGARSREMLAIAYRAAWAGPAADVAEWKAEHVAATPPEVQPLLGSRNQRSGGYDAGNKPPGMPSDAPGISTSRWL